MEEGKTANIREVLYETRIHASRPYASNYPPQPSKVPEKEGRTAGLFSLLPLRGISRIKERWSNHRNSSKVKKSISLFISPSGERVAVATGNQITILQKKDDYQEPSGIFTGGILHSFTYGAWSEAYDILGVVDDSDTVYFIKANGEEISRILKRQLKVSSPIMGLILQKDAEAHGSCFFTILTQDGFSHLEVSQEPSASISSMLSNSSSTLKKKFPENVFCFDYDPERSLLVLVNGIIDASGASAGSSGSFVLSLWRGHWKSDPEQLFSLQFEGCYEKPKDFTGQLVHPKVLISPDGNLVATLDMMGSLQIFRLDENNFSLSRFASRSSKVTSNLSNGWEVDVVDLTWWSERIVAIAKKSGVITMLDIIVGVKLHENGFVYSLPILDRAQLFQGHIFLLESKSCADIKVPSKDVGESSDLSYMEQTFGKRINQFDDPQLRWTLISFSCRSIPEMFGILIRDHEFLKAMQFASLYGLDQDEVLKSQWLHSCQGVNEVNMFLAKVKDLSFVLSECVEKVGQTEDAVKVLLSCGLQATDQFQFSESEDDHSTHLWDFRLTRLQLLQFRDRLETFLGINMGRFSAQEYGKFRVMPLNEAATILAESGKIGALNLLFKRHPYSLSPFVLQILASIPETMDVQTYGQLLPGRSTPTGSALREEDWVECEETAKFVKGLPENHDIGDQIKTEPIIRHCSGYNWPSALEISGWYKNRAIEIDLCSGQLDNCLCLLDFASCKGISDLQQFKNDVSCLYQLIYSDESDGKVCCNISLMAWDQLSNYEKFRMMLQEAKQETVVKMLRDMAIPFMQDRFNANSVAGDQSKHDNHVDVSFLVQWLKEIASENKLDVCLIVFEEGCNELETNGFFKDEIEALDCALQCIYLCTATDRWNTMAALLSKIPQKQDFETQSWGVEKRVKVAEGHIEAGRLLAIYQVPKPISFFLEAHSDEKGVKQILRLILSKFVRRQPSRSDNDWANLWRDMQFLREKAFPFLDAEYMLVEFCRGLLKAGKFSLARNYLRGTSSITLASEKAETLVVQAAREYFFSASSLSCSEIWKANECLTLFPNSANVKAEVDVIDALTSKLPNLGVTLLPMQFRQIKDPMEIIKMAITSQPGAYLHVDDIIEVAKLLGMRSLDEISAVEEVIAREAAVAGDLHLAFDLCLVLAKKGHGPIWDLSAAIARGPPLENMDIASRKQLLGFALSHCDEESISDLLHAWKDLDMQGQCETLMTLTGTSSRNFSVQDSSTAFPVLVTNVMRDLKSCSELLEPVSGDDQEAYFSQIKDILALVTKNLPADNGVAVESLLKDNGKIFSFAACELPWLLDVATKTQNSVKMTSDLTCGEKLLRIQTQAIMSILSWLARNGFPIKDDIVVSLAKSIMEPPVTEEEDLAGCSLLLNLVDAFSGVEVIEEQLNVRKNYQEICSIMNVGMIYSSLHDSAVDCKDPAQRRELLFMKFTEKHMPPSSDEINRFDELQSTFWRDWKLKLEEKQRVAEQSRMLERIFPEVESARFLSGDSQYIENAVFSLIESVKSEKKYIIKDVLKLADTYGLNRREVVQRYLCTLLVSEIWNDDDIMSEISIFREEILRHAFETTKTISSVVFPAIDGRNKQRIACIYNLLSDCYLFLDETKGSMKINVDSSCLPSLNFSYLYKALGEECQRVSFIQNLNFKNIAGLDGLNLHCFSSEVYAYIDELNLEALAKMVQTLVGFYNDSVPEGLISWQDVYKYHIMHLLKAYESNARMEFCDGNAEKFQELITQLEQNYEVCRKYIRLLAPLDALDIMKQYFSLVLYVRGFDGNIQDDSIWQDSLIILLHFWIRVAEEMMDILSNGNSLENFSFDPLCLSKCLKVLMSLVMEDNVSPNQGWGTVLRYVSYGLTGDIAVEIQNFSKAMVFSGCGFKAVSEVFSEATSQCIATLATQNEELDLTHFYSNLLELILHDLVNGPSEHQNLYNLLASLGKLEGQIEDLQRVRQVVWEKLVQFSDNLQLPYEIRVFALEVMQFISGRSIKGSTRELESNVLSWEGFDALLSTTRKSETTAEHGALDEAGNSARFTCTLVALRSSQLVAAISPGIEITADDLSTIDSAVSCFLKLCEVCSTKSHLNALVALLEEWDAIFVTEKDEVGTAEATEVGKDWGNDDWDQGWESFPEEPFEEENTENSYQVHPLHLCWMEIFKKLLKFAQFNDVLRLLDQSLPKSIGTLLNEEEACNLSRVAQERDSFLALKLVLLLPYKAVHLESLASFEERLKLGDIPDDILRDQEFLMIVLCSGILPTIISQSSYGTTFSFLCYLVGNFSRRCQESQLAMFKQWESSEFSNTVEEFLSLFRKIFLPSFVSELVKADQQILAGFVVTKFMHTNAALSLINVAEASLHRYLECQHHLLNDEFLLEEISSCIMLKHTVCRLRNKLGDLIQSALGMLSSNYG